MLRNITLYPWFMAFQQMHFWTPVFFLYFSSVLTIEEVLLLEAMYYLAVVTLEVPSGYFSDRIGRRLTLLVSTLGWGLAALVFLVTGSFWPFVFAQILTAVGMAFQSGTDSSMLFESLKGLGRQHEVAIHESRAQSMGFSAMALSAFMGGALAGLDLRIAYFLSGVSAMVAFLIALRFIEPATDEPAASAPIKQMGLVIRRTREPVLACILLFSISLIVFEHVPYEFFQPYVGYLFADEFSAGYQATPLLTGTLIASMMLIAAFISRYAVPAARLVGVGGVLALALGLEIVLIAVMAHTTHVLVLLLMLVRTVPSALSRPTANAVVHHRLPSGIRATYFSVQSLAGRLAFSVTLFIAARSVPDTGSLTEHGMRHVLDGFVSLALVLAPVLVLAAYVLNRRVNA